MNPEENGGGRPTAMGFTRMESFVLATLLITGVSLMIPSPIEGQANVILWIVKISVFLSVSAMSVYQFTRRSQNPLLKGGEQIRTRSNSFREVLAAFLLKSMRRPGIALMKFFPNMGEQLLSSDVGRSPREFFGVVLIVTVAGAAVSAVGAFFLVQFNPIIGLIMLPAGPIAFGMSLLIPKMSASKRATGVEAELALALSFVGILASGGISPMVTLRKLAEAKNLFPAIAKEAERILIETDVFGREPLSVFEKVGKLNPNKALADFFAGYTSIIKTGGDIVNYIESKLRDIFAGKEVKGRGASAFVGTLAEAYISVTVVLGVSLFVMLAMESMTAKGEMSAAAAFNSLLFSAVGVPLLSVFFIYLIQIGQPQEPFKYNKPYLVFAISLLALPAVVFLPLPLSLPVKLGVGFSIASLPAAIVGSKFQSEKSALESKIADFVLDLAEIRRTGLPPEKGIQQLAERNYGRLTRHIQTMATQLSWGVPLDKVMQTFTRNVKSWIVRAVGFLVAQVVEVGGGTAKMFLNLADFTSQVSKIEKERRSSLRPYTFTPYIGAILVIASTLMLMGMLASPGAVKPAASGEPPKVDTSPSLMLSGAIFQAWVMGFVAGKMGEGSISAGFKHSSVLAAISAITVFIGARFINVPGIV